jgi:hypothetical protein
MVLKYFSPIRIDWCVSSVDAGPCVKIKAIADLTVAATAFLQKLADVEGTKKG